MPAVTCSGSCTLKHIFSPSGHPAETLVSLSASALTCGIVFQSMTNDCIACARANSWALSTLLGPVNADDAHRSLICCHCPTGTSGASTRSAQCASIAATACAPPHLPPKAMWTYRSSPSAALRFALMSLMPTPASLWPRRCPTSSWRCASLAACPARYEFGSQHSCCWGESQRSQDCAILLSARKDASRQCCTSG